MFARESCPLLGDKGAVPMPFPYLSSIRCTLLRNKDFVMAAEVGAGAIAAFGLPEVVDKVWVGLCAGVSAIQLLDLGVIECSIRV